MMPVLQPTRGILEKTGKLERNGMRQCFRKRGAVEIRLYGIIGPTHRLPLSSLRPSFFSSPLHPQTLRLTTSTEYNTFTQCYLVATFTY